MTSLFRPLAAAALLTTSLGSHAAHPLITDDTGTQGTGHWQLEINTDHTRERDAGETAWERGLGMALTYGVNENLDISIGLPWLHLKASDGTRERGVGDTTVLAKWRLYDNDTGWSLALRPEITLPSGSQSRGLGAGRSTAALTAISSLDMGPVTWLANAGVRYNNNRADERTTLWAASTAVLYNVTPQWTLAADLGASRAADRSQRTERYGLLGAIYHANEDLDLDIGWRRSLGAGPHSHTLGAGLTLRW